MSWWGGGGRVIDCIGTYRSVKEFEILLCVMGSGDMGNFMQAIDII